MALNVMAVVDCDYGIVGAPQRHLLQLRELAFDTELIGTWILTNGGNRVSILRRNR